MATVARAAAAMTGSSPFSTSSADAPSGKTRFIRRVGNVKPAIGSIRGGRSRSRIRLSVTARPHGDKRRAAGATGATAPGELPIAPASDDHGGVKAMVLEKPAPVETAPLRL